ncbi:MAG TPA: transketolase [Erysipelotrichaceae bacterium]|nr:transketolase [Erysipelotrichaceae bacterium]
MKTNDQLAIATIRSLCIDTINKANSGHPGMALGSAPALYTLFTRHLVATPKDSLWFNRDRFVLSSGHASALLYSLLHLCGYKVSMDDLKAFRQIDSLTPGHPEYGWTEGVDATSGPLGQGISQAVGMAMAETMVNKLYSFGDDVCNHYTYALCGDGCLQEGVSQESISLAGHLKLNKLILLYDANQVTLDGALDLSFSEQVKNRFLASEWEVLEVKDGNNVEEIDAAIAKAKTSKNKPTLIIVNTIIGYGSAKQGTSKVHGSPLGVEDGKQAKLSYGFDHEDFYVPAEVYELFNKTFGARGEKAYQKYQKTLNKLASKKKTKDEYDRFISLKGIDIDKYLPDVYPDFEEGSSKSTRVASGQALNYMMLSLPNLYGGSADVAASVMTKLNNGSDYRADNRGGHNIHWGIREFAMASAQNGMLLHGGVRSYVGSFFVFSDYMKPAIRMACLSHLPAIYLFSHDSIAVGEDGPTHQPIEQLAMLRSIPNMDVIRPCDERETYGAWFNALRSKNRPTAIILSRQNLPLLKNSDGSKVKLGAYVVSKENKEAQFVLVATGSEVSLAINAQKLLLEKGIDVRVVSMPCWSYFDKQSREYKNSVIHLSRDKCVSIEMLSTFGWAKYCATNIGIDRFGASAPAKDVFQKFNFTPEFVASVVEKL